MGRETRFYISDATKGSLRYILSCRVKLTKLKFKRASGDCVLFNILLLMSATTRSV